MPAFSLASVPGLESSFTIAENASGRGLAEIRTGTITAAFPADRPVLRVTGHGEAALTGSGQANVNQLLASILPSAAIRPMAFTIQQEFALVNGAVPLRVDLGKREFSFPLGGGSTPSGWTLRLPDTGSRFPDIAALSPFQLLGTLHLETGAANRVPFQPSAGGGFEWQDLFRSLLPDPIPTTGVDLAALANQRDPRWRSASGESDLRWQSPGISLRS